MKRAIFVFVLTIIFMFKSVYADSDLLQDTKLFEYKDYKGILAENIKSLKIIRYTEAGASEKNITDKAEINMIYNYLNRIKITDKSNMSCTDNTTVYVFELNDNSKASIEIECDWIVIKGKNYNFKIF